MQQKLKLLIYTPMNIRYAGGFEQWLQDSVEALNDSYEISIACGDIGDPLRLSQDQAERRYGGARSIRTTNFWRFFGVLYIVKPISFIGLIIQMRKADMIYFNYAFALQDVLVLIASRIAKKKVIVGYHAPIFFAGAHDVVFKLISAKVLKLFAGHHVINAPDKQFLDGLGYPNVHMIPNYVAGIHRRKTGVVPNKILFAGRYEQQKGFDALIDGVRLYLSNGKKTDFEFHFYGTGTMAHLVRELSADFSDQVFDNGHIEDKAAIYDDKKFILVPSRNEPFGLVILEAMSRGVVVASTSTFGAKLMIRDGINGLIIDNCDPITLARTIDELGCISDTKYSEMSEASYKMVEENYLPQAFVRDIKLLCSAALKA